MAVYKVLQDIEAEDKFVGPLTLKQFIYGAITGVSVYISVLTLTKGIWIIAILFLPVILFFGFLAWPWGRDQPTEIWLLAKVRFMFKPRRRIWDQTGLAQNVTITAPKKVEKQLTKGLSQSEVKSRLHALADTIDSRGWAVKNVNVNLFAQPGYGETETDRLVGLAELPREVSNLDITPSDDMLDASSNPVAQHLEQMMNASTQVHMQQIMQAMQPQEPSKSPKQQARPDFWFMNQPDSSKVSPKMTTFGAQTIQPSASPSQVSAVTPTPEEIELFKKIQSERAKTSSSYGHTAVIQPPGSKKGEVTRGKKAHKHKSDASPPAPDPGILGLARNDDLNVATIARVAKREFPKDTGDGEVIVPLRPAA